MATSVRDLLIRLDTQVSDLHTPVPFAPSRPALERAWRHVVGSARRLDDLIPAHTPDPADRRFQLILRSFPPAPGLAESAGSVEPLVDLSMTLGTISDLLTLHPIISQAIQQTAGLAITDRLQSALGAAAAWTLTANDAGPPPGLEVQLRRLAGYRTEPPPAPPLATAAWRLTSPEDPGLDGAAARWANAAELAIADPRTVSQLGLQLTTAGIALICRASAAVPHQPGGDGEPPHGGATAAAEAAVAWEQAACWPAHLHLGGRSTNLRDASGDLRDAINDRLNCHDRDPVEHHLATVHSALQAACRVGHTATDTLRELSYGASRVWTQSERVVPYLQSAEQLLAASGRTWLPDAAGMLSASPLHRAAVDAQDALTRAATQCLSRGSVVPGLSAKASETPDTVWEITTAPSLCGSAEEHALDVGRQGRASPDRRFL